MHISTTLAGRFVVHVLRAHGKIVPDRCCSDSASCFGGTRLAGEKDGSQLLTICLWLYISACMYLVTTAVACRYSGYLCHN